MCLAGWRNIKEASIIGTVRKAEAQEEGVQVTGEPRPCRALRTWGFTPGSLGGHERAVGSKITLWVTGVLQRTLEKIQCQTVRYGET